MVDRRRKIENAKFKYLRNYSPIARIDSESLEELTE